MQTHKRAWWEFKKSEQSDVPARLFETVKWLESQNNTRRIANLHHLRMYSNRLAYSMSGQAFSDSIDSGERIKLNVIKSAIDAAVAQNGTNRPRPMFLTEGGSYSQRKKAERLGRFVMGQFHRLRQYELSLDVYRDAAVWGTGFELVYHDGHGHICVERVLPDEILVDENECRAGRPRQMFREKQVSKSYLKSRFPKFEKDIEVATSLDVAYNNTPAGLEDPCTLVEAWRLPSMPDAGDGRHVISLNNKVLLDEEWKRDTFPIISFRWNTSPIGFFGVGAAEEISPIQVEINFIAQKIQKLMTLATSMVWKEKGSFSGKITNEDMAVREFTGKPPLFQTTASVSSEYFTHLDRLYNRAYELVGVSQLSASSKKPGGIDSGVALRIYNDIGSKRFQHIGQRWEQFHLDVAEQILEAAREIDDEGHDQELLTYGDKEVEKINFSDVRLDREVYVMKAHPVSIIPDTPTGKLEIMHDLAQIAPAFGPRLVSALSGIPDLEAATRLINAPQELADKLVERILDKGEYVPPSPYMGSDLLTIRTTAQLALLKAESEDVEPERLEMLRQFIDAVDEMQAPPPAPSPAPMPPGGMPGLPPGLPPGMPPGMPPGGPLPEGGPQGPLV